jgi:hypothetical protein
VITVAVMTVGRLDYLRKTLSSLEEQVTGFGRVVLFDDSGNGDTLDELYQLEVCGRRVSVASWGRNLGYTQSLGRMWEWLATHDPAGYFFHLEEDFTFDRPVHLTDLTDLLDRRPVLDQVALLRHAYYPRELRAGGIVEEHPEAYVRHDDHLEHSLVFTCNPSVYRRDLVDVGWPQVPRSERAFTKARVKEGRRFAYWGDGTPWITHIGAERSGIGGY